MAPSLQPRLRDDRTDVLAHRGQVRDRDARGSIEPPVSDSHPGEELAIVGLQDDRAPSARRKCTRDDRPVGASSVDARLDADRDDGTRRGSRTGAVAPLLWSSKREGERSRRHRVRPARRWSPVPARPARGRLRRCPRGNPAQRCASPCENRLRWPAEDDVEHADRAPHESVNRAVEAVRPALVERAREGLPRPEYPESKASSSSVTVCVERSMLRHVTIVPTRTSS